ncbi:hypothetical protein HAX54_008431 [Datura stramonium]|uniref:Uncharacterized protein n=1 Tax=Datura stramonium TaxID=4076 RepID=A0ABS8RW23_DATST|nr:hypothetical protein [Datura stramonium]
MHALDSAAFRKQPSTSLQDYHARSDEWFALRKDKLTTSTFSTALGFWKGNRRNELWHEKLAWRWYPGSEMPIQQRKTRKGSPIVQRLTFYYMPQVQGQMEIMDRDWVDVYCWTPNGSTIFRVYRGGVTGELMHVEYL